MPVALSPLREPTTSDPAAGRRAAAPSVHALGLAAAGALVLLAAAVLPLDAPPLSLFACPLRAATGIPCFSCGATHAFSFMMHGRPAAALAENPLAGLGALSIAAHCAWTALRLCGLVRAPSLPRPSPRAASVLRAGAVLLLMANWLFVALRGAT
ncbi:MAG: hypothetical protein NVS2B9_19380 [Myxococcales bacterium]